MSLPLVSIGVPFFNNSKTIAKLIENLLDQDYQHTEIILSDNCSTDDSKVKIQKFLSNKKIRYFRNDTNMGAIFNHNVLIDYAKGKYFMWAHTDDLISKNYINDAVSILENDNDISSVIGKMTFFETNKTQIFHDEPQNLNVRKFERIKNFIETSFSDSLIMGLHRSSILVKKRYIMSPEIPFIFNLLLNGKIQGCPSIKYFKYNQIERTMKEKIQHYKYKNLIFGRFAWYFISIIEILKSDLKINEKINLVLKFKLYNLPLLRNFFKKKSLNSFLKK